MYKSHWKEIYEAFSAKAKALYVIKFSMEPS